MSLVATRINKSTSLKRHFRGKIIICKALVVILLFLTVSITSKLKRYYHDLDSSIETSNIPEITHQNNFITVLELGDDNEELGGAENGVELQPEGDEQQPEEGEENPEGEEVPGTPANDAECEPLDLHPTERCEYIHRIPDCIDFFGEDTGFVNYAAFLYCNHKYEWGTIPFMILVLLWYFLCLGVCAEDAFSPIMAGTATEFKMSDGVAGVTLLAFANGAPDVFSSFAALTSGKVLLGLSALFGSGTFVPVVVLGLIGILAAEFTVTRFDFLRDTIGLLFCVCLVYGYVKHGSLNHFTAVTIFMVYIIYAITVLVGSKFIQQPISQRRESQMYQITENLMEDLGEDPNRSIRVFSESSSVFPEQVETEAVKMTSSVKTEYVTHRDINEEDAKSHVVIFPEETLVPPLKMTSSVKTEHTNRDIEAGANSGSMTFVHPPLSITPKMSFSLNGSGGDSGSLPLYKVLHQDTKKNANPKKSIDQGQNLPGIKHLMVPDTRKLPLSSKDMDARGSVGAMSARRSRRKVTKKMSEAYSVLAGMRDIPMGRNTRAHSIMSAISQLEEQEDAKPSLFSRILEIASIPISLGTTITVPIPDEEHWDWRVAVITPVTAPLFFMIAFKLIALTAGGFPIAIAIGLIGSMFSVYVWLKVRHDKSTIRFTRVYLVLGIITGVSWIYAIANELVNLLAGLGSVFGISEEILGLTVLAWGNSVGDAVSNITMARYGFPRMSIAACLAAPLFNLAVSVGLSMIVNTLHQNPFSIPSSGTLTLSFMEIALAATLHLIVVPIQKWRISKYYGIWNVCLYVIFIVVAIAQDLGAIHIN